MSERAKVMLRLIGYAVMLLVGAGVVITRANGGVTFIPLPIAFIGILAGGFSIASHTWYLLDAKRSFSKKVIAVSSPFMIVGSFMLSAWLLVGERSTYDEPIKEAPVQRIAEDEEVTAVPHRPSAEQEECPTLAGSVECSASGSGYWEREEAAMELAIETGQLVESENVDWVRNIRENAEMERAASQRN